jgi:hypothetical protein
MIETDIDSLKRLVAHRSKYVEGCEKARFDQQPAEACATISACLEVFTNCRVTSREHHREDETNEQLETGLARLAAAPALLPEKVSAMQFREVQAS